ncbi:hypothetical protein MMSR116_29385 [Methylobacterium mesophilicum SR1.6/6]|uniref:Uncharacterized protein n=1 Tax=Methylobacterium mesophilicum SR1.6/6 TaxID=908290 RepID=A0A6B9FSI1_9HYPH|nr:hypothetical protein [Methylobacterium mesophilicum]QGY05550.1 hypothetical protein MMSR116_29385 [Methylobacterium mesophilicum SR1.6/6]
MPHPKEHPLAGRRVVPDAETGEELKIIDWLDRLRGGLALLHPDHPEARAFRLRVAVLDLHASGAVLARSTAGLTLVHHAELPSYDPVPVGVIS